MIGLTLNKEIVDTILKMEIDDDMKRFIISCLSIQKDIDEGEKTNPSKHYNEIIKEFSK